MKERKNLLLLTGGIISVFPLLMHIIKLVDYATKMELQQNILLQLSGNVALYIVVILFAVLQMIRNYRNNSTWVLPVVGMVLSGYCFAVSIPSVARFIIVIMSDSPAVQISKTLFLNLRFMIMVGVTVIGGIGHILLLMGYIKSLPKRKA